VNPRKEYFQIQLAQIEAFAHKHGVTVEFTKLAEAREYRETLNIRQQKIAAEAAQAAPKASPAPDALPDELFPGAKRATG
jgi:hypothetical protein